jgi:5-methyltetrahydrofolate--homocysteine methyltransferase
MDVLRLILSQFTGVLKGRVIIGTVKGDLYDIGKNLVGMILEGVGFDVIDLGIAVSAEKFVEAIKIHQPCMVRMSALLTTTIREIKNTIGAIQKAGFRDRVRVIVGGAPVSERFAKEIGADGYAPDAGSAGGPLSI